MDLKRIAVLLDKQPGVSDWFLRRYETEKTTIIRLPNLVAAHQGRVESTPNPAPREVILNPAENVYVTVYSRFEADNQPYMGEAVGQLLADDESAVRETVAPLVAGARSQKNRPYSLPPGSTQYPTVELADPVLTKADQPGLISLAQDFNDRLIKAAQAHKSVQVSNLELFIARTQAQVRTSTGVRLEYPSTRVQAEVCFTTRPDQGRVGEYTARLEARRLSDLDPEQTARVCAANSAAIAAAGPPSSFSGPVVLIDEAAADAITGSPFRFHSNARLVFEKAARYQQGKPVTGDTEVKAECLDLTSDPLIPFGAKSENISASDCTPAQRVAIVKRGNYAGLFGLRRHVEYLGLLDQGLGPALPESNDVVAPGKHKAEDLMAGEVVIVRAFSDWTVDPASGEFACEVRLGELRRQGKSVPFKGGLLVGNYFQALADINFSKETIRHNSYHGPKAVRFNNLKLAG